jgi:hypothetical protein
LLQNIVSFLFQIEGRGMGVNQLLAFDSSRSKLGYLEIYGGLLVYIFNLCKNICKQQGDK